jgi:phage terminase large subunit
MSEIALANYGAENRKRIDRVRKLNADPVLALRAMQFYKTHPVEFINDWCITFDPRNQHPIPKLMPFILFPRQVEFIEFLHECYLNNENGLIEKCRDMGASWLCVAFTVWAWLFDSESVITWGSRKEEYVDRAGDPKAIFPKIRQTIENLPKWMRPRGYDPRIHATYMRIINPVNGAIITGEAGDNIGRGGRSKAAFVDEEAHIEHQEKVDGALSDNTKVRFSISSVNGSNNLFYRRRMAGEIWEKGKSIAKGKTRVFIMDWRDHPAKTQEWYDRRRQQAEDSGQLAMFAQEVDRDYSSSIEGIIIRPEWVRACIDAHIKLGFEAKGDRIAAQDVADGGRDVNAYASRHGVVLQTLEKWGGHADAAARNAIPLAQRDGVTEFYYDSIGIGASFKTEINYMQDLHLIPSNMRILQWIASNKPTNPNDYTVVNDPESRTNDEQYGNLKAQAWIAMYTRCYKTFRAVNGLATYDPHELISFPSNLPLIHQLTLELSQATKKISPTNGKEYVNKQPDGAPSPNLADAVVMCYHPAEDNRGFFDF